MTEPTTRVYDPANMKRAGTALMVLSVFLASAAFVLLFFARSWSGIGLALILGISAVVLVPVGTGFRKMARRRNRGPERTPEELQGLVDDEIRGGWDEHDPRANPHGVELDRSLTRPPERRTYLDSFNKNQPIELWLVLEEDPDEPGGYQIVYSEERDLFGLAIQGDTEFGVMIGYHGSFLQTLAGM